MNTNGALRNCLHKTVRDFGILSFGFKDGALSSKELLLALRFGYVHNTFMRFLYYSEEGIDSDLHLTPLKTLDTIGNCSK